MESLSGQRHLFVVTPCQRPFAKCVTVGEASLIQIWQWPQNPTKRSSFLFGLETPNDLESPIKPPFAAVSR